MRPPPPPRPARSPGPLTDPQEKSVLREVAVMRRLRHRNIVNLLGAYRVSRDEDSASVAWFLVQELVSGGEVFNAANIYSFSEEEAAHVVREALEAVWCVRAPSRPRPSHPPAATCTPRRWRTAT